MDVRTIDAISSLVTQPDLKNLNSLKAFLGFDACIDIIVRIVKNKNQSNGSEFFVNSREFGEFLISNENTSCGIELRTQLRKPGGNMVITANALGNLGIMVDCAGTFGFPDIMPVFKSISPNCKLHSVGDTISATAIEFDVSKIILFDPGPYDELNWDRIKDIIGIDRLKQLVKDRQLISFLNWSEIQNSTFIWEGFLDEILPGVISGEFRPVFFTDFSDCSRRSVKEIKFAIDLLDRFRNYFKVIISLNQKEAELISRALNLSRDPSDEQFMKLLFSKANADIIVIHRIKDAIAYDGKVFEKCETFFCKDPLVLTGGGDNFNAGFCYSVLHNFNLFKSLITSNAVSGYYVKTGTSPDIDNLIYFLKQKLSVEENLQ